MVRNLGFGFNFLGVGEFDLFCVMAVRAFWPSFGGRRFQPIRNPQSQCLRDFAFHRIWCGGSSERQQ